MAEFRLQEGHEEDSEISFLTSLYIAQTNFEVHTLKAALLTGLSKSDFRCDCVGQSHKELIAVPTTRPHGRVYRIKN